MRAWPRSGPETGHRAQIATSHPPEGEEPLTRRRQNQRATDDQGRHLGGFWVGISQLPRSHPWTVRRIWRLHQLGLFGQAEAVGQTQHSQPVT